MHTLYIIILPLPPLPLPFLFWLYYYVKLNCCLVLVCCVFWLVVLLQNVLTLISLHVLQLPSFFLLVLVAFRCSVLIHPKCLFYVSVLRFYYYLLLQQLKLQDIFFRYACMESNVKVKMQQLFVNTDIE